MSTRASAERLRVAVEGAAIGYGGSQSGSPLASALRSPTRPTAMLKTRSRALTEASTWRRTPVATAAYTCRCRSVRTTGRRRDISTQT
jgi:hypothetical protein